MTDAELVTLSQQGDLRAFNELAGRANDGLYRFVRRMLGNSEDARDLSQEALIKAYVNIGRLRDPEKFAAWLHHIALNLCRDWHRAAHSRPVLQSFEGDLGPESEASLASGRDASFEPVLERERVLGTLQGLLERLSLEQRTAILLREYQGFTSQEIAEITGVPAATVRTRIFYGLKAIRGMLDERGWSDKRQESARPEGGERR
ncbi:MAG: RNA polymerase sigma factor [Candidatus Eisenbacteria bacterium]